MKDTTKAYLRNALVSILFVVLCSPISRTIINYNNDDRISDLYEKTLVSTVQINRNVTIGNQQATITGSGVFIDTDIIVTNNHVVDNREFEEEVQMCYPSKGAVGLQVTVEMSDGRKLAGRVILAEPENDIALIKIDSKIGKPVHLGDSDKARVGDEVLTIGSSLAITSTLGVGYITGKHRTVELAPYENVMQVSTGVFPGNSGGGLFNLRGELVGIVFAGEGESGALGFVIPINLVKTVLIKSHHSFS